MCKRIIVGNDEVQEKLNFKKGLAKSSLDIIQKNSNALTINSLLDPNLNLNS